MFGAAVNEEPKPKDGIFMAHDPRHPPEVECLVTLAEAYVIWRLDQ